MRTTKPNGHSKHTHNIGAKNVINPFIFSLIFKKIYCLTLKVGYLAYRLEESRTIGSSIIHVVNCKGREGRDETWEERIFFFFKEKKKEEEVETRQLQRFEMDNKKKKIQKYNCNQWEPTPETLIVYNSV